MNQQTRSTLILFILGIVAWIGFSQRFAVSTAQVLLLIVAIGLPLIPGIRNFVLVQLDRFERLLPRYRFEVFLLIVCLSSAILFQAAVQENREFNPLWHDTLSYLTEMQILATGHLWLPQHPMADFFETFHVLTKPVYTSIYFPGTAMLFLPQVWLDLPTYAGPLIAFGLCAGLLHLIISELLDPLSGILSVLLLIALRPFRQFSIAVISSGAMLLLALALFWCFLCWRRSGKKGWMLALGGLAGWGAITRPLDAFCICLPIGLAILWDLRKNPLLSRARTCLPAVACATPFLLLQLYCNYRITGDLWTTPYRYYMDRFAPQINPGFHTFDPSLVPQTTLPQKLTYHKEFNVPAIKGHRPNRIFLTWRKAHYPIAVRSCLASPLLLLILFLGIPPSRTLPRLALVAPIPLFVVSYTFYPFILSHYWLVVIPGFILLVLASRLTLEQVFAQSRGQLKVAFVLSLLFLCGSAMPQFNSRIYDDFTTAGSLMTANFEFIPKHVKPPAVVLFRYVPVQNNYNLEPVYNIDVAWPDDAPIIRAHDLGPRNIELLHYYAERQPERTFYLFNRQDNTLERIGTAGELADQVSLPSRSTAPTK